MRSDDASGSDPERTLALSYAPEGARAGVAALFALDSTLGQILRSTREPVIGQMRLTWWFEALNKLDTDDVPAEPVLQVLSANVLSAGVTGARLGDMIDAWEVLIDGDALDSEALETHARRGVVLFGAAATLLGLSTADPVAPAGRGWALADLARHVSDRSIAAQAAALAEAPLAAATQARWSREGRALGALAHLARMDMSVPLDAPVRHAAPGRIWRLFRHRLTGR